MFTTAGCQDVGKPFPLRDVDWDPYSKETLSVQLAAGNCVFVFVYPKMSGGSPFALYEITDSVLRELCKRDTYVAMLLKYDDWDDERYRHIAETVGSSKEPFVILFSPHSEAIAFDPFTLDRKKLL